MNENDHFYSHIRSSFSYETSLIYLYIIKALSNIVKYYNKTVYINIILNYIIIVK